jgi:hypothetical protein
VATAKLRALAQQIADALPEPVVEVVLTGSVSRGMADATSDIEMLVVTEEQLALTEAFALSGLRDAQTWGPQTTPSRRVFGYVEGVPVEQIWWSRAFAEEQIAAYASAEAIANGVPLRTSGLLPRWQEHLRDYPDEVALARIEQAAETWGGYAPAGVLTVTRAGERVARVQRMVGDAERAVTILFALNRVWEPTLKRLALRVEPLPVKPDRFAERIDAAFAGDDFLALTELALETVRLAPDGPNVVRAREWLAASAEELRR